ncbi:hypothetical protein JXB31_05390 [Candidatus Woesearchaeota archaeon]|nr:hypothetical protein [Candidatus Woesearchaeota archaeon]
MNCLERLSIITICLAMVCLPGCSDSDETDSGSVAKNTGLLSDSEEASSRCRQLCMEKKAAGTVLDNGPCLSDEIITDWVCDVAHSPRIKLDDHMENQCPGFREGSRHHFVEVDPDCNLIKIY